MEKTKLGFCSIFSLGSTHILRSFMSTHRHKEQNVVLRQLTIWHLQRVCIAVCLSQQQSLQARSRLSSTQGLQKTHWGWLLLTSVIQRGSREVLLCSPGHLWDSPGNLYLTDTWNHFYSIPRPRGTQEYHGALPSSQGVGRKRGTYSLCYQAPKLIVFTDHSLSLFLNSRRLVSSRWWETF